MGTERCGHWPRLVGGRSRTGSEICRPPSPKPTCPSAPRGVAAWLFTPADAQIAPNPGGGRPGSWSAGTVSEASLSFNHPLGSWEQSGHPRKAVSQGQCILPRRELEVCSVVTLCAMILTTFSGVGIMAPCKESLTRCRSVLGPGSGSPAERCPALPRVFGPPVPEV